VNKPRSLSADVRTVILKVGPESMEPDIPVGTFEFEDLGGYDQLTFARVVKYSACTPSTAYSPSTAMRNSTVHYSYSLLVFGTKRWRVVRIVVMIERSLALVNKLAASFRLWPTCSGKFHDLHFDPAQLLALGLWKHTY